MLSAISTSKNKTDSREPLAHMHIAWYYIFLLVPKTPVCSKFVGITSICPIVNNVFFFLGTYRVRVLQPTGAWNTLVTCSSKRLEFWCFFWLIWPIFDWHRGRPERPWDDVAVRYETNHALGKQNNPAALRRP